MKKRYISLLLTFALIFTMIPAFGATAMAASNGKTYTYDGTKIKFTKNLSEAVQTGKTLDGNYFLLPGDYDFSGITVAYGKTVRILLCSGSNISLGGGRITVNGSLEVYAEDNTAKITANQYVFYLNNSTAYKPNLKIYGGTFEDTGASSDRIKYLITDYGGCNVDIFGGVFEGPCDIYVRTSTLNVYGGTFNNGYNGSYNCVFECQDNSVLNISGGEFNKAPTVVALSQSNVTISGGIHKGIINKGGAVNITGGNFWYMDNYYGIYNQSGTMNIEGIQAANSSAGKAAITNCSGTMTLNNVWAFTSSYGVIVSGGNVTMSNVFISANNYGVLYSGGDLILSEKVIITGNNINNGGANLYVGKDKQIRFINISGNSKIGLTVEKTPDSSVKYLTVTSDKLNLDSGLKEAGASIFTSDEGYRIECLSPIGIYNIVIHYDQNTQGIATNDAAYVISNAGVAVTDDGEYIQLTGDAGIKAAGLEYLASDVYSVYGASDASEVTVVLNVYKADEASVPEEIVTSIKDAAGSDSIEYISATLMQKVDADEKEITDTNIAGFDNIIEMVIPFDTADKENISVYCSHEGSTYPLYNTSAQIDGSFYVENNEVHIFTTKFSVFAIAYDTVKTETPSYDYDDYDDYDYSSPAVTVTKPAENTVKTFDDVAENDYYYDAVLWAAQNDITNGTDDTHFSPEMTVTRAQMVTFLWNLAGKPEVRNRSLPFADIKDDTYYYKAVLWAAENGITQGVDDGTNFAPDMVLTRAMAVCMLYRYNAIDTLEIKDNPFADVSEGDYYYDAVLWAAKNGITNGTDDTHFSPNMECSRAQAVTFIYNLCGK